MRKTKKTVVAREDPPTSKTWPAANEPGQSWTGGLHGKNNGLAGNAVSVSPGGLICMSIDLVKELPINMPNAMLTYFLSFQALRIRVQQEITAGSLRWVRARGRAGRINAKAALKSWGLLPKCGDIEIHEAVLHTGDGRPYIDVDLVRIVARAKPPRQCKKSRDASDTDPDNF
jgi:hypothetical protein